MDGMKEISRDWSWVSSFWKRCYGRLCKKAKYDIETENNEELTMDEPGKIVQGQSISKAKNLIWAST